MNWNRINFLVGAWIVAAIVVSRIPASVVAPFLDWREATAGVVFIFVAGLRYIASALKAETEAFDPPTPHAAKRLNEQLKLSATSINAIALALATGYSLTQFFKESRPDVTMMIIYAAVAMHFHIQARALLGLMKDESVTTTTVVQ